MPELTRQQRAAWVPRVREGIDRTGLLFSAYGSVDWLGQSHPQAALNHVGRHLPHGPGYWHSPIDLGPLGGALATAARPVGVAAGANSVWAAGQSGRNAWRSFQASRQAEHPWLQKTLRQDAVGQAGRAANNFVQGGVSVAGALTSGTAAGVLATTGVAAGVGTRVYDHSEKEHNRSLMAQGMLVQYGAPTHQGQLARHIYDSYSPRHYGYNHGSTVLGEGEQYPGQAYDIRDAKKAIKRWHKETNNRVPIYNRSTRVAGAYPQFGSGDRQLASAMFQRHEGRAMTDLDISLGQFRSAGKYQRLHPNGQPLPYPQWL